MISDISSFDTPALEMTGICKRYPGTLAVDTVDFDARVGEVHALMGENGAGKSTLMKILAGSFSDYIGNIRIGGQEVKLHSPAEAKYHGIGMIYQELSLALPVSIAENILIGQLPTRFGFLLDTKKMVCEAKRRLDRVKLDIDPMVPVKDISQHEAQLVEIAKVLGNNPCILVMDEPTSSLSRDETERLFNIINDLRKRGLTIIYISHHLSEVFRIADRVTVLRDGKKIGTHYISEVTPEDLVSMMVGRSIDTFYKNRSKHIGPAILEITNLTRRGFFHHISFQACEGEILGIAGLSGAGRTELARSICGLDPVDSGEVLLAGEPVECQPYRKMVSKGMFYLSEDRKTDGLFLRLSVNENLVPALIPRNTKWGWYSPTRDIKTAYNLINKLDITTSSPLVDVNNLSGGNQQKVLLGKWIAGQPRVLFLDEPTRGVDVNAKIKIHQAILEVAENGNSVVLISSDLPELVGLSDRIIVMRTGHIVGEMQKNQMTEESVLLAINGHGNHLYE